MSEHVAGRELDALIAERVMGFVCLHELEVVPVAVQIESNRREFATQFGQEPPLNWTGDVEDGSWSDHPPQWCKHCHTQRFEITRRGVPRYSTDIAAAWQVVEKIKQFSLHAPGTYFERYQDGEVTKEWHAAVVVYNHEDDDDYHCGEAYAPTAPLAICRAALKAVEAGAIAVGSDTNALSTE